MDKVAIVFWTGSGNTEAMAQAVEEGAKNAGAETVLSFVGDTSAAEVATFDKIILGCPAMGDESLEEYDFELLPDLAGKKVGIFGSYAWNEGDWIMNWKARLEEAGVTLAAEPVKAYSYPDDDALEACRELGKTIAEA